MHATWMGMEWVQRGWEPLATPATTNQKEAFTGTVRLWGCQTWHPLRRPELDKQERGPAPWPIRLL